MINNPIIYKFFKDFSNHRKKTNRAVVFSSRPLDQDIVWESNDVKLLAVTMDNSLRFDEHVSNICFKSKQEVK